MFIGDLADILVTPFRVISVSHSSMPDQTVYDSTKSPDFPFDLAFTTVTHVQVAPDGVTEIEYDPDARPENRFLRCKDGAGYVKDLAKKLSELSPDDMIVLNAILDRYSSVDYAIEAVKHDCVFYKDVTDWEQLASEYLHDLIAHDDYFPDDILDKYFDYRAFAAELRTYNSFIETPHGIIKLPD